MKIAQRIAVEAMAEVLDPAGLTWRTVNGGKHLCVVVVAPDGTEHKMPVSGTPRDQDAAANMLRQSAQRLVERLGVGERRGQVTTRKARHHRRYQPERTVITFKDYPDKGEGPLRDPWSALATLKVVERPAIEPEPAPPPAAPGVWARLRAWVKGLIRR